MGSKWQTWEPNSGHPALNRYNTLFLLKKERKVRFHPFHVRPRSWSSPLLCFYSTHPVLPLKSGYSSSSRKSSLTSQGHHDQVFLFFSLAAGTLIPSFGRVESPQSPSNPKLNAIWCVWDAVQLSLWQSELWKWSLCPEHKSWEPRWLQWMQNKEMWFPRPDSAILFPPSTQFPWGWSVL